MTRRIYFYHPDYTVGIGIAPIQPKGSQTITAGLGIAPYPENKSLRIKYPQDYKYLVSDIIITLGKCFIKLILI